MRTALCDVKGELGECDMPVFKELEDTMKVLFIDRPELKAEVDQLEFGLYGALKQDSAPMPLFRPLHVHYMYNTYYLLLTTD